MSIPTKKFILRIPLRKLKEAQKKKNAINNQHLNTKTQDTNDTDSTVSCPQSPKTIDTMPGNDDDDDDDDSEDMHDIHSLPQDCGSLQQITRNATDVIPALDKQLSNNDIYTDDDDDLDHNGQNGRKLILKSAFSMDTDDSVHSSDESDIETDQHQSQSQIDIEMKTHNDERERLRKQKESNLRMVDREYENLMKEMNTATNTKTKMMPSNEILKIERQKEIESIATDENDWLQNEKHAISMRHISIRDDKKRLLESFIAQSTDNNQFKFIKVNLETYFKLKQRQMDDNVFINTDRLQLSQLFNCELDTETQNKMVELIHKFEQYLMEKHFTEFKTEKSVKFSIEHYERDCGSVKNKLESCPMLYVLLMKKQIDFDALLSADMISICLICINAVIRKKIQRKLESLVKKQNAISVENELFKHWKEERVTFIKELKAEIQIIHTQQPQPDDNKENKEHKDEDDDVQIVDIEDPNKILHDQYPLFCQQYLKFLRSFPNYRNRIINNELAINKILQFTKEELVHPPVLESKKPVNTTNIQHNTKKRKHVQGVGTTTSSHYPPLTKRRKLSTEINPNNNSKQRVIWDGLLINDAVKCHVKMKQIGGKSIWTLPFKYHRNIHSEKQQLTITGRINILSIIKFIKQLRKHKTRRIIFAELESNEYVNHNSYTALCGALRSSNRAGVIDFEKQCGILIYIMSSSCLSPTHAMSHQLNKYFDGHKARTPKTKMFSIIILSLDVYNQVKRKMSKGMAYNDHMSTNQSYNNNNNNRRHPMTPAQPPKPTESTQSHKPLAPRPPQPPAPPNTTIAHNVEGNNGNGAHKSVDDVWDTISNEIEDDLGELPPPLPAHLLAERERYKQQTTNNIIPNVLIGGNNDNMIAGGVPPMQPPAPPPLPMPHNQTVYVPAPCPPVPQQQIMYQSVQPPPVAGIPVPPRQLYGTGYPPHPPPHYG